MHDEVGFGVQDLHMNSQSHATTIALPLLHVLIISKGQTLIMSKVLCLAYPCIFHKTNVKNSQANLLDYMVWQNTLLVALGILFAVPFLLKKP